MTFIREVQPISNEKTTVGMVLELRLLGRLYHLRIRMQSLLQNALQTAS